jgi:predicted nucleic acid-binding protein
MIFTQENEYAAVLDACVLVPMALCDCLLRLAENPALYRPLWSEEILQELTRTLKNDLQRKPEEISWRLERMKLAFPEALVEVPRELLSAADCLPDKNDRHVLAAAIMSRASTIVTQNTKHFPKECLDKFGVVCQSADEFLVDQYHLAWPLVLDKLDDQAAAISQTRKVVLSNLKKSVPEFCKLLEVHI